MCIVHFVQEIRRMPSANCEPMLVTSSRIDKLFFNIKLSKRPILSSSVIIRTVNHWFDNTSSWFKAFICDVKGRPPRVSSSTFSLPSSYSPSICKWLLASQHSLHTLLLAYHFNFVVLFRKIKKSFPSRERAEKNIDTLNT